MTLSPYTGPQVRGIDGPKYTVGPRCCNPGCKGHAEHAHHIFRRTDQRLGGAYDWVEIKGAAYQNVTGICPRCHDLVTGSGGGHKAAIKIIGEDYDWKWWWCSIAMNGDAESPIPNAPIQPQPMTPEAFALTRTNPTPESEACPTCGHVTRARSHSSAGGGRARKSWTIKVPDDALENGADILDTLVDDLGVILGVEANQTGRYYIILPCVYYAHQEKARFIESLKGMGG